MMIDQPMDVCKKCGEDLMVVMEAIKAKVGDHIWCPGCGKEYQVIMMMVET